jgi:solute carrier family 25 uncoupling protein 27
MPAYRPRSPTQALDGGGQAHNSRHSARTAALSSQALTYPIDFTKTRLQLAGEGVPVRLLAHEWAARPRGGVQGASRSSLSSALKGVLRLEGWRGFYVGIGPAVVRHIPYTSTRIFAYEQLRGAASAELGCDPSDLPIAAKMVLGMTAGGLGQLVAVPADVVKIRMQSDGQRVALGLAREPRYTGMADAFSKIKSADGLRGFWTGSRPAIVRAMAVNLGELATYDTTKQALLRTARIEDGLACHVAAAAASGFAASLASNPFDVAKTRIMNQTVDAQGRLRYSGVADCIMKVARTEGAAALYKGFLPSWARLAPWQLTFWCTYEHLRCAMGLRGF